jgi:hypothetical protein
MSWIPFDVHRCLRGHLTAEVSERLTDDPSLLSRQLFGYAFGRRRHSDGAHGLACMREPVRKRARVEEWAKRISDSLFVGRE